MRYPSHFILLFACCLPFIGCQPDSPLEDTSLEVPAPDERSRSGLDAPAVATVEPAVAAVASAVATVALVKPEAQRAEAQRPEAQRPEAKYLNYTPAPMGPLTDGKGRSMLARIIAANDAQVRVEREDGNFFVLNLDTLSAGDQVRIRAMEGLPRIDAEGQVSFQVYDFGAVGDGETDDGPAIRAAVAAAIQSGPGSVVVFEDTTYRMLHYSEASAHVMLEGVSGLTLGSERDGIIRFDAMEFGLKADGVSDDGPAIRAMLAIAVDIDDPVLVRFPKDKVIAVKTGMERYVFQLHNTRQLTIDGNGCEFLLDPYLRFINLFDSEQVSVKNLQVDYTLQATAPGTIMAMDEQAYTVDVQLDWPDYAARMGGSTKEDGEQDFFGMYLLEGPYETKQVKHFYVFGSKDLGNGRVRIQSTAAYVKSLSERLKLGETRIGLPVPGIAHRHGPGALCRIDYSDGILFQDVEIWTAPWFSFQLFRNRGSVTMRRVHVRPRPGSGKVLSSCRDAFHAKGNRGKLLFEDCILSGLGDDAFNIATHCSRIRKIHTMTEIEIRQQFPLQYIPLVVGDTLVVMNGENNEIIGERRILSVEEFAVQTADREAASYETQFVGNAPFVRLRLDAPLEGMQVGQVAFARESSNPSSTIRGCSMDRSSRFQANVELENCRIDAFTWFYGDEIEGPGPESVSMRNCKVRAQMIFSGWGGSHVPDDYKPQPASAMLKKVILEANELWGPVSIQKALEVNLSGNRFPSRAGNQLKLQSSGTVRRL